MGRGQFDPRVAIGLAAILLLLAALPYDLWRSDDWWPGTPTGHPPTQVGDSYAGAAEADHFEPQIIAVYISLAAVEVAGGAPQLVSYRGSTLDPTPGSPDMLEPLLVEMLGSVLDTSEQNDIPTAVIEEASARGLFAPGPGGTQVATQTSSDRRVVAVVEGGSVQVIPYEWLDSLPEAQP